MKTRLLLAPLLIAAVAALAGCGGSQGVPSDAVALVGSTPITKAQFNQTMTQAIGQAKAAGQPAPKIGTPTYNQLRDRVIAYLVQVSELQQEAAKEGVTVTPKDVDAYLQSLTKLKYGGSTKKLDAAIRKSGLTVEQARQQVAVNLLAQKVRTKVTSSAKVSTADEKKYYESNTSTYHQAKSRSVRHILVSSKSEALKIEAKLKANPGSFPALAKKYSKDTGTAQLGGNYTAVEGRDVPQFDQAAFSLKTNQISAPVHSQFGWHIIQALGPVKPAHTVPFKQAQAQIQQQLLSQQQSTLWSNWLANLQKQFQGKVKYQAGYAPPPTTSSTIPTSPPPAPTTTG